MKDILTDEKGDLLIVDGDLVIDVSDDQHQEHIIIADKGDFKETPELGVGIINLLSDDDPVSILIEIKKNLEYDGVKVKNVKFSEDNKIIVDGTY